MTGASRWQLQQFRGQLPLGLSQQQQPGQSQQQLWVAIAASSCKREFWGGNLESVHRGVQTFSRVTATSLKQQLGPERLVTRVKASPAPLHTLFPLLMFICLLFTVTPAWGLQVSSGTSSSFLLNTQHFLGLDSTDSMAFALNTQGIHKIVRDGVSPAFALVTSGKRVDLPSVPLPQPPVVSPAPVPVEQIQVWNASAGAFQNIAPVVPAGKKVFIISHGWNNPPCPQLPGWMADMAAALAARDSGSLIMAWNWLKEAEALVCPPGKRVPEQGRRMHARLKQLSGWNEATELHIIGFSLGAGVAANAGALICQDIAFSVPKRVTLLDPPEDLSSHITDFQLESDCSGVHLDELVRLMNWNGARVENIFSNFGKSYTHAHNVDLRSAANHATWHFPYAYRTDDCTACGTSIDPIPLPGCSLFTYLSHVSSTQHNLAPRWYIETIRAGDACEYLIDRLMGTFFFYHKNGPEPYYCSGASGEGYNRETLIPGTTWSPEKVPWTWYSSDSGWVSPAYLGDSWEPWLYVPENLSFLDGAWANKLVWKNNGFMPFVLSTSASKAVFDFSETFRSLVPNLAAEPLAWQAGDAGGAFVEDGALHLETSGETYAYRDVVFPPDVRLLRVVFEVVNAAQNDQFGLFLDDTLAYSETLLAGENQEPFASSWINVSALAGQTVRLTLFVRANSGLPLHIKVVSVDLVDVTDAYWRQDSDDDGLDNYQELVEETDPADHDSDADGMYDGWEVVCGFDPHSAGDAAIDSDDDGLSNVEEFTAGTNPFVADTDEDTYTDAQEIDAGSDPLDPASTPETTEGEDEGSSEGEIEEEGQTEGNIEGYIEGQIEGSVEGEGGMEGEGMPAEGSPVEGEEEGSVEGQPEGQIEGDGTVEILAADQNGDGRINLSELLRVIQFFNSNGFHCETGTEDGYAPGPGDQDCPPYDSDYNAQDWYISLSELLRVIQFFNSGGYHYCPAEGTEDDFCPGQ